MNKIRKKELFGDVKYILKRTIANEIRTKYFECCDVTVVVLDYHKWRILQEPLKHATAYSQIRWNKWLESVRKDIERVFGILKKRFLILKYGMEYNSQKKCDNVFLACCMIHNILHAHNGYGDQWDEALDDLERDAEEAEVNERVERELNTPDRTRLGRHYFGSHHEVSFDDEEVQEQQETSNYHLKMCLVEHFAIRFSENTVRWPSV